MTDEPPGEHAGPTQPLAAFAALGEPTRRALYQYVADHGGWVGREAGRRRRAGSGARSAAHHLDRLAADGLLDVAYQPAGERRGPGAGRPAKLYRRAARQFELSLPPASLRARRPAPGGGRRQQPDRTAIAPRSRPSNSSARRAGEAMAAECRVELPVERGGDGCARRSRPSCGPAATSPSSSRPARSRCATARSTTSPSATPSSSAGSTSRCSRGLVGGLPAARLTARLEPGDDRCCVTARPVGGPAGLVVTHLGFDVRPSCQRRSSSKGKMPVAWPSFHVIASPHAPCRRASSTRSGCGLPARGHAASPWSRCARHVAHGQPWRRASRSKRAT